MCAIVPDPMAFPMHICQASTAPLTNHAHPGTVIPTLYNKCPSTVQNNTTHLCQASTALLTNHAHSEKQFI